MNLSRTSPKANVLYALLALLFTVGGVILISMPDKKMGLIAIGGALALALMIAIYLYPPLGANVLIITVFTNLSRQFTDRGLPSINKPLVALVAVAIIVHLLYTGTFPKERRKTALIEAFLLLFLLVTSLSYIVAADKGRASEAIQDLVKDIVILYSLFFTLTRPEIWKRSVWIIILSTAFLSLLGTYQVLTHNYEQTFFGLARVYHDVGTSSSTWRLGGPINEPNFWGQVVAAVVPLTFLRLLYEPKWSHKLLALGILGLLIFEILNTYSRGAFLALAIAAFFLLLRSKRKVTVGLAIIGAAILIFAGLPSSYQQRLQTLNLFASGSGNSIYQDASIRGRTSELLSGLMMFERNPLLGVGAGNYMNNYPTYAQLVGIEIRSGEREPHSLYVQILAESGLSGIIGFAGFILALFFGLMNVRKIAHRRNDLQAWEGWIGGIELSLLSYLTTSIFLHGAYLRYFWILAALGMAAIQITYQQVKEPRPAEEMHAS